MAKTSLDFSEVTVWFHIGDLSKIPSWFSFHGISLTSENFGQHKMGKYIVQGPSKSSLEKAQKGSRIYCASWFRKRDCFLLIKWMSSSVPRTCRSEGIDRSHRTFSGKALCLHACFKLLSPNTDLTGRLHDEAVKVWGYEVMWGEFRHLRDSVQEREYTQMLLVKAMGHGKCKRVRSSWVLNDDAISSFWKTSSYCLHKLLSTYILCR